MEGPDAISVGGVSSVFCKPFFRNPHISLDYPLTKTGSNFGEQTRMNHSLLM
jgi:hypothetical protein